jgi:O-antigen ligase
VTRYAAPELRGRGLDFDRVTLVSAVVAIVASAGMALLISQGRESAAVALLSAAVGLAVGLTSWRWSIWGLLVFMPFSGILIFATYPSTAPAVLAKDVLFVLPAYAGFFSAAAIRRQPVRVPGAPTALLLVFALLVLLQVLNPALPNTLVGLVGAKVWLLYMPLLYVGYQLVATRVDLHRLLAVMSVAAIVPAAIGLCQALLAASGRNDLAYAIYGDAAAAVTQDFARFDLLGGGSLTRSPSTFSFVSQYYAFLISMIAVSYAWWRSATKRPERRLAKVAFGLIVVSALLSGSRSAFLFVPLLLALIALLERSRRASARLQLVAMPLIGLVGTAAVLGTRTLDLLGYAWSVGLVHLDSVVVEGMSRALGLTLLGYGTGANTNASRYAYAEPGLFQGVDGSWFESWYAKAHLELGVVGLALILALLVSILLRALAAHRRLADPGLISVSAGLVAFVAWVAMYSAKAQPLDLDPVNVYFWLLVGVILRLPNLERPTERR